MPGILRMGRGREEDRGRVVGLRCVGPAGRGGHRVSATGSCRLARAFGSPRRGDLREDLLSGLLHLEDQAFAGGVMLTGGKTFQGLEPGFGRLEDDDRVGLAGNEPQHPPRIGEVGTVDPEPGSAGIEAVGGGSCHGRRVRREQRF